MSAARILKWITGSLEALLAVPFLGGLFVIGNGYTPLMVMLVLHIVTLILCVKRGVNRHGSILGIATSVLGWIPVLGWTLHAVTAIVLMVDAAKAEPAEAKETV